MLLLLLLHHSSFARVISYKFHRRSPAGRPVRCQAEPILAPSSYDLSRSLSVRRKSASSHATAQYHSHARHSWSALFFLSILFLFLVPPPYCRRCPLLAMSVYVTIGCPSVRPFVCPLDRQQQRRAAGLLQTGSGQRMSIDSCRQQSSTAGSVVSRSEVRRSTQTCFLSSWLSFTCKYRIV